MIDKGNFTKEQLLFIKNRKLKDNNLIGRIDESDNGYIISDIRRSDFSKMKYKPRGAKALSIRYEGELDGIVDIGKYYEFRWLLQGKSPNYTFEIDPSAPVTMLTAKDVVKRLHDDIFDYPPSASEKIVKTLDTLKNQLTASGKEVFIYELLQNANDYPKIVDGKKRVVK